jgi:hypothetical protein
MLSLVRQYLCECLDPRQMSSLSLNTVEQNKLFHSIVVEKRCTFYVCARSIELRILISRTNQVVGSFFSPFIILLKFVCFYYFSSHFKRGKIGLTHNPNFFSFPSCLSFYIFFSHSITFIHFQPNANATRFSK